MEMRDIGRTDEPEGVVCTVNDMIKLMIFVIPVAFGLTFVDASRSIGAQSLTKSASIRREPPRGLHVAIVVYILYRSIDLTGDIPRTCTPFFSEPTHRVDFHEAGEPSCGVTVPPVLLLPGGPSSIFTAW